MALSCPQAVQQNREEGHWWSDLQRRGRYWPAAREARGIEMVGRGELSRAETRDWVGRGRGRAGTGAGPGGDGDGRGRGREGVRGRSERWGRVSGVGEQSSSEEPTHATVPASQRWSNASLLLCVMSSRFYRECWLFDWCKIPRRVWLTVNRALMS